MRKNAPERTISICKKIENFVGMGIDPPPQPPHTLSWSPRISKRGCACENRRQVGNKSASPR